MSLATVSRRDRPLVAYADGHDCAASPPSHFGSEPCDVLVGWMPEHRAWLDGPLSGWTLMAGYALRDAISHGKLRYLPARLSAAAHTFAVLRPDVVVVSGVRRGHELAYGRSVGWAPIAVAAGAQLVVEIDDDADDIGAPLITGPVHRTVTAHRPFTAPPIVELTETDRTIAASVVSLLPRDATMQFGLGAVADAVARAIDQPVRIWSGFVSDAVAELADRGHLREPAVGAYVYGGDAAAGLCRDGGARLVPVNETHGAAHLARLDHLVAVNTAVQVGLDGSVNVERVGGRTVAGIGGHPDFCAAAARAADGLSVIALRARHRGGSTIVPRVETVSTPRSDVDVVVTEHGVADLRGADDGERAERLLAVAAPEHRAALAADLGAGLRPA